VAYSIENKCTMKVIIVLRTTVVFISK